MVVNKPEILRRGMYGDNPDRPEVEATTDIDDPAIPEDLQQLIQQTSVDPEPEEAEEVVYAVDAAKVADENPQSRFKVCDVAALKPGVCALCGSAGGDGRQFVDFGKTMDWYGVVYFCTFCVSEAAKLLGFGLKSNWISAEQYLQDEISAGDDRYIEAKVKLDAAMVLLRNCTCSDSGVGIPTKEEPEEQHEGYGDSSPNVDSPATDESDADELSLVEGPDDISESSGVDEPDGESPVRKRTSQRSKSNE